MAGDLDSQSLTLRVNPEIAKALKTRESGLDRGAGEPSAKKSAIIQVGSHAALGAVRYFLKLKLGIGKRAKCSAADFFFRGTKFIL